MDREQNQTEIDWLLWNADWLVTCDPSMRSIEGGAVAVDSDRIIDVGRSAELKSKYRGRREFDLSGYILMPGLVNTHCHAAMSCLRGIGDDLPLERWLQEVIFPAEANHAGPEFVYWGTLLAAVEMLQNGVTTFCDGYFFEEEAAAAAIDCGTRAVLAQGILDFPSPDQADPGGFRKRAEAFLKSFPCSRSRVRPSLFCHAPYTCSPETLRWVKELCSQEKILFQIHLSETQREVEEITGRNKTRPTFYLDRLQILDRSTLCAHAVWLNQQEIDLLRRRKAGVSHNVESNMKLGAGVSPVPELLRAGVKVGLGTDGCASNNDLDLFSEMDKAAKLHKVFRNDPEVCPAGQILQMATLGGAAALGWEDEIGSLETGKKADLIAIDLNQPHLVPIYDPISHLIYAVKGSDVRYVWVDGKLVVQEGGVKTVDTRQIMHEVRRIAHRIKQNSK